MQKNFATEAAKANAYEIPKRLGLELHIAPQVAKRSQQTMVRAPCAGNHVFRKCAKQEAIKLFDEIWGLSNKSISCLIFLSFECGLLDGLKMMPLDVGKVPL